MKMSKIMDDITDLLDGDSIEHYDIALNVGKKADNVSISSSRGVLYVTGWKGHKPAPAVAE